MYKERNVDDGVIDYIQYRSPAADKMVYLTDPVWLSLFKPSDEGAFEWMQHSSTRDDVKDAIRKDGGIIFEDLLEKMKSNFAELTIDEIKILEEM